MGLLCLHLSLLPTYNVDEHREKKRLQEECRPILQNETEYHFFPHITANSLVQRLRYPADIKLLSSLNLYLCVFCVGLLDLCVRGVRQWVCVSLSLVCIPFYHIYLSAFGLIRGATLFLYIIFGIFACFFFSSSAVARDHIQPHFSRIFWDRLFTTQPKRSQGVKSKHWNNKNYLFLHHILSHSAHPEQHREKKKQQLCMNWQRISLPTLKPYRVMYMFVGVFFASLKCIFCVKAKSLSRSFFLFSHWQTSYRQKCCASNTIFPLSIPRKRKK